MTCANGVCAPTATQAVLNVSDLENLLASGNVEVTTTGAGVQAKDIVVKSALAWSASNALALDAWRSITAEQPVSVQGLSGLTLTINDGGKNGDLRFGPKGDITFANLSSSLTIDGTAYTLVNTVQGLASAIANNPGGAYALANTYNAKPDGTYTQDPINITFPGILEGLGNSISHLSLGNPTTGFIYVIGSGGVVRDFALVDLKLVTQFASGGLAQFNLGNIAHCHITGAVKITSVHGAIVGALVAANGGTADEPGTITDSSSSATVTARRNAIIGGLVGVNQTGSGSVIRSFSSGAVVDVYEGSRSNVSIGGLVGINNGMIADSYSVGAVIGTNGLGGAWAGGLVGGNSGAVTQSYSTGALEDVQGYVGGLIGYDTSEAGSISSAYWDTDTSGITNLSQGAGNIANDPGITGLTTAQFQSGLPAGFDPAVWAENPNINGGLPYLISNPPPK